MMAGPSLPVVAAGGAAVLAGTLLMRRDGSQLDLSPPDPTHITPHFTWAEFRSHDGVEPEGGDRENVKKTASLLEVIRDHFDGSPVTVVSGFRSATHNDAVEGADHSQHLTGKAADITVAGISNNDLAAGIEELIKNGDLPQGGLGVYPGWVHYDWRGYKARWAGH